jgi:hypothetical protein
MYRICVRGRISEQRVAMTVDGLAAFDHRGTPSPQIGENQMKRRQFQRSPAEYGSGAARTPRLLHRMRDAARPTGYLRSVFAVRPIGPEGLA